MSSPQPSSLPPGSPPQRPRPALRRAADGRVLAGVCAGLADHLGLHPLALRVGFIVLTAVGGLGALVYAFLWATIEPAVERQASTAPPGSAAPRPTSPGPTSQPDAVGSGSAGGSGTAYGMVQARLRQPGTGILLVLGGGLAILVGAIALVQTLGLNLRLDITLPVLVLTIGAVFVWSQLDTNGRDRLLAHQGNRQQALGRLIIGVGLVAAALIALTAQGRSLDELRDVGFAVVLALVGVGLLAAPYVTRLWRDLREEQAATARATERADIAAHLHDSVLQTLALIQRRADDPGQVTRLARAQERELRSWLYAGPVGHSATLAGAVAAAGHDVEDVYGVPIELVVTGDRPLDDRGQALVNALREALINAVRHGAAPVSAYVEVGTASVEAFVRDHGPGFELDDVPEDRLGVRESILGRMQRHGGTAAVRRLEHGTEVSLELPLGGPPADAGPRQPDASAVASTTPDHPHDQGADS